MFGGTSKRDLYSLRLSASFLSCLASLLLIPCSGLSQAKRGQQEPAIVGSTMIDGNGSTPIQEAVTLKSIVISVEDLDASLRFYSEVLGFKKLADVELRKTDIKKLWGLRRGTRARIVVMGREGADSGMVRLVQFAPRHDQLVHRDIKLWDLGACYIHVNVDSVERRYTELKAKGFEFFGPPTEWKVEEQNRTIREALFHGPDGLIVDLLHSETGSSKPDEKLPKYSEIVNSAQVVPDMDEALAFYRDTLGLAVLKDQVPGNKQLDSQLQFPPGTRIRVVHLGMAEKPTSRMELVQFLNIKGRDLIGRPPNIGLFMLSFAVEDIEKLIEEFRKKNISVKCLPTEIESTLYGKRKVATAQAPNGLLVEFVESQTVASRLIRTAKP